MARLPVFIVGVPRSGTTLLRLLLNAHPDIAIPDETGMLLQLYVHPGKPRPLLPRIRTVPRLRAAEALGPDIVERYRRTRIWNRPVTVRGILDSLFSEYARVEGKRYWGEKTPAHVDYVADIARLFPRGTILYVVRDPRAVVASYLRYGTAPDRTEKDDFVSDSIEEAVSKYRSYVQISLALDPETMPRCLYFVSYERLVDRPRKEMTRICESLLGIPFSDQMLQYAENASSALSGKSSKRADGTVLSWKKDNTRTVTAALKNRWQEELSDRQVAYVEYELADCIAWNQQMLTDRQAPRRSPVFPQRLWQ